MAHVGVVMSVQLEVKHYLGQSMHSEGLHTHCQLKLHTSTVYHVALLQSSWSAT